MNGASICSHPQCAKSTKVNGLLSAEFNGPFAKMCVNKKILVHIFMNGGGGEEGGQEDMCKPSTH